MESLATVLLASGFAILVSVVILSVIATYD
jgi:hypothetical protein